MAINPNLINDTSPYIHSRVYNFVHFVGEINADAEYQDEQAVYDFYGNVIEGEIQPNKHKLVVAWIEIHREDLISNWDLLQKGKKYFKITPLR